MNEGWNDEPNEKMNRGEPHYNEQNVVCTCACVSRHKTIPHTHTRT